MNNIVQNISVNLTPVPSIPAQKDTSAPVEESARPLTGKNPFQHHQQRSLKLKIRRMLRK